MFACPNNEDTIIKHGKCPITECPYHVDRVGEIFTIEKDTGCTYYDTHLMANTDPVRTQISALSRDPTRKFNLSVIRGMYSASLGYAQTLHELTHEVTDTVNSCPSCMYPKRGACASKSMCDERTEWVHEILNLYQVEDTPNNGTLIWEQLLEHKLFASEELLREGLEICQAKDVQPK